MTKEEFNTLKRGDVVTHCVYGGYFIVQDIFDDEFIDTQDIQNIGVETEFGYEHDNWKYEFCTKITNQTILDAIKFSITDDSVEDRNEFVYGVEWLLNTQNNNK